MDALFPSTAATRGDPLRLVVRVNEAVREVVAISRRVNLVALNAMLAAKQTGIEARGFGVVSGELRQFSGQLDRQMHDLDDFIHALVHAVAESARLRRHRAHFDGVEAGPAAQAMAPACQRMARQQARVDNDGDERWDGLRTRLDRALRLCGTGVALSRSAKIEAVYDAAPAGGLRQVAEEIEAAILSILATLKQLRGDIAA